MSKNSTAKTSNFGRIAKVGVFGLALVASVGILGGTAGAAASGEAELGSALSASISTSADGTEMIRITEVGADGVVRTITVPANSGIRISGIDQARQSINLAAM